MIFQTTYLLQKDEDGDCQTCYKRFSRRYLENIDETTASIYIARK
jgi:hypothetical protein